MVTAVLLVVLLGSGASFAFDRDGNGIDDGGLDLSLPPAFEGRALVIIALLVATWTVPHWELLSAVRSNPRSPPSLRSVPR